MRKALVLVMGVLLLISGLLIPALQVKAATLPGASDQSVLVTEWSYELAPRYEWGFFGSSPAIADLGSEVNAKGGEPDADLEIVVGSDGCYFYSSELDKWVSGLWRCLDSRGNCEWATDTLSDEARSSPAIVDLNADGYLEIAAGTTSGETLQVMDRFGSFVWTFPTPPRAGNFYYPGSPAVADLNPAVSGLEVVIGNRHFGTVLCLDGDNSDGIDDGISASGIPGSPYAGVEGTDWDLLWIFYADGPIWASPAVADIDNDGMLDVVIGSTNGSLYVLSGVDGSVKASTSLGASIYASVALADLDNDGYLEIVVGALDGRIYAFTWDGAALQNKWTYPSAAGAIGAVYSSAAIGDVDGDGSLDLVVGSTDGSIYCLGSSGNLKWSYSTGGAVYSSPALADRGEGGLGIYVGSDDRYLYLLTGTGTLVDRFLTYGRIRTSPAVADIDGDSKLEVVLYDWSPYDTLWCLEDTGSSVDEYAVEWQMFRHDASRTGLYAPVVAGVRLPVPYYGQGDTQWCMPASMSMILKYYGKNVHLWDIAKEWGLETDEALKLVSERGKVEKYFAKHGLSVIDTAIDFDAVKASIDESRPVFLTMHRWIVDSLGHAVVIVGYRESDTLREVYVHDPSGGFLQDKLGLPGPYISVAVDWQNIETYAGWKSYALSVAGDPMPVGGTINLFDKTPLRHLHFLWLGKGSAGFCYDVYDQERGLVWEYNQPYPLVFDSDDQLLFWVPVSNHTEHSQTYTFVVEFTRQVDEYSWESFARLWDVEIGARTTEEVFRKVLLGEVIGEYGEYVVTVSLLNQRGETYDSVVFPSIVYGPVVPPTADFDGSPTRGFMAVRVSFTDKSTGDIESWLWDFGDGRTSTKQNPSHTYLLGGPYTVKLTVGGPTGTHTIVKEDYIEVHTRIPGF